jgi:hypothetical protein
MRCIARRRTGHAKSVAIGYGFTQGARNVSQEYFLQASFGRAYLKAPLVIENLQLWISCYGMRSLDLADRPGAGYV